MKERPIIFSGDMVKAILDGRKTQTRRPIKPQPLDHHWDDFRGYKAEFRHKNGILALIHTIPHNPLPDIQRWNCPYGMEGDRLWVRETWIDGVSGCINGLSYRSDHNDPMGDGPANPMKWRPSIYMPKWASRITLEVKKIRVERLQEISEKDIVSEGIDFQNGDTGRWFDDGERINHITGSPYSGERFSFMRLWDSIYAKKGLGWKGNPYVWVIEFERIKP